MAIRKTHVKSDKRIKRDKEAKAEAALRTKQQYRKPKLGSRKKTVVDTRFKFKSQSERYKDISVDLASLLEDAVERFGKWDIISAEGAAKAPASDDGMDAESSDVEQDDDEDEDMISSPMSAALAELVLLNTSIPFHNLHKALYTITRSLPLILHHRQKIANLLTEALSTPNYVDLALSAPHVIDLIPSFIQCLCPDPDFKLLDLDTMLTPLMKAIVALAVDPPSLHAKTSGDRGNDPNSPVEISKRAFQVLAWTFRQIGNDLVNGDDYERRNKTAWSWVVDGLKGQKPIIEVVKVQEDQQADTSLGEGVNDIEAEDHDDLVEDVVHIEDRSGAAITNTALEIEMEAQEDELHESDSESSADDEEAGKQPTSARRRPLSATKPHLRRLLATCYAFLLRRAKNGECLDSAAATIFASLQESPPTELLESISWLILESLKSVDGHIHSRGPPIFRSFIRQAIAQQDSAAADVLIAALTAALHHARLETAGPAVEVVIARLRKCQDNQSTEYEHKLVMQLVDVLTGTRKGSRLSDKDKANIISNCNALRTSIIANTALIPQFARTAGFALLNTPNLECMLNDGRKLLDGVWNLPKEYANLSFAVLDLLSEQRWPYFENFVLPLVRAAGKERFNDPACASLLATISERGQLPPIDTIVGSAESKMEEQIKSWIISSKNGKVTERQSRGLLDALTLSRTLSHPEHLHKSLMQAIEALLALHPDHAAAKAEFDSTPVNAAAILSAFIASLGPNTESLSSETILRIVELYGWHRSVLASLASIVSTSTEFRPSVAGRMYAVCKEGLLSQDPSIRENTLKLLRHCGTSSSVIDKALEVEHTPLTAQAAREKTMHLRKLGITMKSIDPTSEEFETGLLYCFAMLKVNFKPLWSEAISVLSELHKAHGNGAQDLIWSTLYSQLAGIVDWEANLSLTIAGPVWAQNSDESARVETASWQQGEFRCTASIRWASTFTTASQAFGLDEHAEGTMSTSTSLQGQVADVRLSTASLEEQLLGLCCALPSLTERHSKDFVELFLSQFGQAATELGESPGGKTGRERLSNWLKVLATFKNPKALYRSDEIYRRLLDLLSHGDSQIQGLALDGILTWKSPNLLPYEANFRNFLQSSHLRDELLNFSLAEDTSDIMPERREQVVNITIRILFGLMSSRQGRASSLNVQKSRKSAILNALKTCNPSDLDVLVDLMAGPFRDQSIPAHGTFAFAGPPSASASRQLGYLSLLGDVLAHLGDKIRSHWQSLFVIVLNLAYNSRASQNSSDRMRHVRQLAFRRIGDFYKEDPSFDVSLYLPTFFAELITPRLAQFGAENAQGPSALLEIIATWATYEETASILVHYDTNLLPSLYSTLSTQNVKDSVITKVLDVAQKLLNLSLDSDYVKTAVFGPYIDPLLAHISSVLASRSATLNMRDHIGVRLISVLSGISPFVTSHQYAERLLPILLPLLAKPNMLIPEKIKVDLLQILETLLAKPDFSESQIRPSDLENCYRVICSLFTSMRGRPARVRTLAVFRLLQLARGQSHETSDLLDELNAFSTRRVDEPDFDRRLAAFSKLNDDIFTNLGAQDWIPILANMFFFIQDPEELSIRSNANASLRRFVQVAGPSLDPAFRLVFARNFMPALKRALRSKADIVRTESLTVLHAAVQADTGVAELEEMKCLLAAGDDEASFFNNIYHIQSHRRARALRRLTEVAQAHQLSSKTLNDIFLPLVAYNLDGSSVSKAQEVVNESVTTIGRLSSVLQWGSYHRLLQQYFTSASDKRDNQKVHVRVLVAILRGFHFDLNLAAEDTSRHILTAVEGKILPKLLQYLQSRNETEELLRIPVAEGIAVIVQHLPEDHKTGDVTNLITALSQILRSKSQEVRDLTRTTLVNIAVNLGPEYLATFVKELRASLAKGPHLHVLAFVLHTLLERLVVALPDSDIDACLGDAVPIVYDDLFGFPSKDRESTEFRSKTKYREVRLCKSLDSIEILAAQVSSSKINALLGPLRGILADNDSMRVMQVLDDVLRRIVAGLLNNKKLQTDTLLTLCQALISQNTDFLKPRKPRGKKDSTASKEYRVQLKRRSHSTSDSYRLNAHRFVAFGLDLLNGAFRKNRFDLQDEGTVSRLDPLIVLVGDTLFTEEAHVLDRALRAVASLIKCPLASIEKATPVLVKQMISILENMGGTASDLAQTTIRSLANLIRERKSLELSEEQLASLVAMISPDLEEPDQQAALFSLLRSIVSRKFATAEVYDLMDRVAEILIASQSNGTREICRSIYLQFLLDYPQGKKRLATSLQFLAKNLGGYVHESGRMSALDLVNAILSKFGSDLLDQYADLFHIALVMDLGNDESPKCRSMAAENVKVLYARVTKDIRKRLVQTVAGWGTQRDNQELRKVSAQVAGVIVEAVKNKGEVEIVSNQLLPILIDIVISGASAVQPDASADDFDDEIHDTHLWQPIYQALSSLQKVITVLPDLATSLESEFLRCLRELLIFPHTWIRQAASRLLGLLYSLAPSQPTLADLIDAASASTTQLKSKHLDDVFALQIVKNLFFIGKRFAAIGGQAKTDEVPVGEEEELDVDDIRTDEPAQKKTPASNPLHWLFVKLSHRARVSHQSRPSKYSQEDREWKWSTEPTSILRWFAAMISEPSIDDETLGKQTWQILLPIVRIIEDPNGAQDPQLDELQSLAREVQEMLSKRLGSSPVLEAYSKIQRNMTIKREGRKRHTALQAVTNPEVEAHRRASKNDSKLKNRKRKNESFRETKLRYGVSNKGKRPRRSE